MKHKSLFLGLLCIASYSVFADVPFTISIDRQEVTDTKTGLIWRSCPEGMSVNTSNCSGFAIAYTHEEAVTRAKTQAGWRLPTIKELSSITDLSRQNPAIDIIAFPSTPSKSYFWTSSPLSGDSSHAWAVEFATGASLSYVRTNYFNVRLVR